MKVHNSKDEYRCLFAFMLAYADSSVLICYARSAYLEMPKQSTNFSPAKNRFVGLQLPAHCVLRHGSATPDHPLTCTTARFFACQTKKTWGGFDQ